MRIYTELETHWQVDSGQTRFSAPATNEIHDQRLVFNDVFRDGEIAAKITIHQPKKTEEWKKINGPLEHRSASLIFRFQNPNNYYYAGLGGLGSKFLIAKVSDGVHTAIEARGRFDEIPFGMSFNLSVRCEGNRISLLHNSVIVLEVFDNNHRSGQWGLQTWRTRADFEEIKSTATKPRCFVIMPFAPEFDSIFDVIQETITSQNFDCIRADKRYLVGSITDDINEQIKQANLVIADLTAKNPNVYYEVGYAAALQKPVIQISQSVENLPFDVRHLRTFAYTTKILGDRRLSADLISAMRALA